MSRIAAIGAALLALAGALLGAPAAFASSPAPPEGPTSPDAFKLDGSNGYTISVTSFPAGLFVRSAAIAVTVSRGEESATYTVGAKVTEDSIHADLGKLGHVDLRLRRSGADKTLDIKCVHRPETYEAGVWEGSFEFDGEGGYTRAHTTSVAALPGLAVAIDRKVLCNGSSSGESRGFNLPGAKLAGVSFAGGRILKFKLNKNRRAGKTVFSASLAERRDGIRIFRQTEGVGPASAFRYAADVKKAKLAPPAPFSGTAEIIRDPDAVSPSISGNLRLAFPGRSIKLTGPSVHISFNHARLKTSDSGSISIGS